MTFDNEYTYIDYEFDDNFLGWYEIEGLAQITEHSRQIRTLLKFKCATIRYFYRKNTEISLNMQKSNFFKTKSEFELLALQFIKTFKEIKAITGVLEEGIQIIQKNKHVTAFDRFSAYYEFYIEGLTKKFTKLDIEKLFNWNPPTSPNPFNNGEDVEIKERYPNLT